MSWRYRASGASSEKKGSPIITIRTARVLYPSSSTVIALSMSPKAEADLSHIDRRDILRETPCAKPRENLFGV
jgi:hypothetical protein